MNRLLMPTDVACLVDLSKPCFSPTVALYGALFWFVASYVFKFGALYIGRKYYSKVDPNKAFLPDTYPMKPVRGKMDDWTRSVMSTSESELNRFLEFRQVNLKDLMAMSLEEKQVAAAKEAVAYRNELFDDNLLFFHEANFLRGEKVAFPVMMSTWNPKSWFGEMGTAAQYIWCGNFSYAMHHTCGGLGALYCLKYDITYVRLLCYMDMCFNLLDLLLMPISLLTKHDYCLYSGNRRMDTAKGDYSMIGFYKLMVKHHVGASILEYLALAQGTDSVLIAEGSLAMMGTTGMLHFASVLSDSMPIRENKIVRFYFTALVFAVCVHFRGILWVFKFFPELVIDTYGRSGILAAILCTICLLMFSKVNYDFIKVYWSKTKKMYEAYKEESRLKKL